MEFFPRAAMTAQPSSQPDPQATTPQTPDAKSSDPEGSDPECTDPKAHDFEAQKELHQKIRNDPDYDDWEYGTEPLPHEAWVPKQPPAST
jgi:hypothetical protein